MRKHFKWLTLTAIVVTFVAIFTLSAGAEAEDFYAEYIQISQKEDLLNIRDNLAGKYVLVNDIVFTDSDFDEGGAFYNEGRGWTPIGDSASNFFSGIFDGNGHTISGLYTYGHDVVGLFGYVYSGTITNLNMVDFDISGKQYIGSIVGVTAGTIESCSANGKIQAVAEGNNVCIVGGIVGIVDGGTVHNCTNLSSVNVSSANGASFVGGIVGQLQQASAVISNSRNTGVVMAVSESASSVVGGIAGYNVDGIITECTNSGSVSANTSKADAFSGGIVGYNGGTINICSNLGYISAEAKEASGVSGGIVGKTLASVYQCYNAGDVTAFANTLSYAGGVVGESREDIHDCYNIGYIKAGGTNSTFTANGGIVGAAYASIGNCYSGGGVDKISSYMFGNIVGWEGGNNITTSNCYYGNIMGYGGGTNIGTHFTLDDMMLKASYIGFDFDNVWTLDSSKDYPFPTLKGLTHINSPKEENTIEFSGGTGSFFAPYKISTTSHLNNVRNYLGAYYVLTDDLVFTDLDFAEGGAFYNEGRGWEPLGTSSNAFEGVFYGNHHIITGLFTSGYEYAGLFGYVEHSLVNNLGLTDSTIYVKEENTDVYGGGIIGYAAKTKIVDCSNDGIVYADLSTETNASVYVGGIVGVLYEGIIQNCYNFSNVSWTAVVSDEEGGTSVSLCWGGIMGYGSDVKITNSYNSGSIKSNSSVRLGGELGGIAGVLVGGGVSVIDYCHNTGAITGDGSHVGGVVGYAVCTISNCYNVGDINGGTRAGGISGRYGGYFIDCCYNTGNIDAYEAGGIIGYFSGSSVSNCFNLGAIKGRQAEGGIIGAIAEYCDFSQTSIINCYNIGMIKSNITQSGAIIGVIYGDGGTPTIVDCYYESSKDCGVGRGTDTTISCSLEQMKLQSTYTGFDFDKVWIIDENGEYPLPTLKGMVFVEKLENTTDFAGGNGTIYNPYKITNCDELNNIRNYLNDCYVLINDIVFEETDFLEGGTFYNQGKGWEPIGDSSANAFEGLFNGGGHSITGLYTSGYGSAGLFGYQTGTVMNLHMIGSVVNGIEYAGGISGYTNGRIADCSNTGSISSNGYGGGISGYADRYSSFINCENVGDIEASNAAGGISGYGGVSVVNCHNTGMIEGDRNSGGIIGYAFVSGTNQSGITILISDCYNAGMVGGGSYTAGGILGYFSSNSDTILVNNCYNTATIKGKGSICDVGGIGGSVCGKDGSIRDCYNTGTVNSAYYAGGIIGRAYIEISNSYNIGNVNVMASGSTVHAGGIAGAAYRSITDCYNIGDITAITRGPNTGINPREASYAGGICGVVSNSDSTIRNCYSVGAVAAESTYQPSRAGGIIGAILGGAKSENCFYLDIISLGVASGTDTTISCSIEQMKLQSTYTGFDFDTVWGMDITTGFPCLPMGDIISVNVYQTPSTLKYAINIDTLDLNGGKLGLTYSNGAYIAKKITEDMVVGFDNTQLGKQQLTVTYGSFTAHFDVEIVPPYTTGDLDGVEGVSKDDAVYLLKSILLGTNRYPIEQSVDFNGDGVTNKDDAVYLLKHVLLGAGRYPLN